MIPAGITKLTREGLGKKTGGRLSGARERVIIIASDEARERVNIIASETVSY